MSSEDHIDMDSEPIPQESAGAGNKRKRATTSSSSALPPKPKKKIPKRAEVWQHFTQTDDDLTKSTCKYCSTEIGCDTVLVGTSPMKSHLNRCKAFKDFVERGKQQVLSSDNSGNMKFVKYDPLQFRRSVSQLVVVNELSFSFVESEGWRQFCADILPLYQTFSRRTCGRDIVAMYLEEKAKLKTLFSVEKKRVSLTTDIWVSPTTSYNYMVVTGHWIDVNWKMQKRNLSFKVITDHKGDTISKFLLDTLDDWGIEKVFTVTVDNAKGNDKALRVFRDELRWRGGESLVIDGDLIHMRCCAHILNLIVGDGLKKANKSIVAVRNAVKYVRSSYTRLKSFVLKLETGKIARGSLPLDCVTRWNSTYLMLSSALKLRIGFEKLSSEDKLYCDYFDEEDDADDESSKTKRVGPPTSIDWDEVQRLVTFLKIFYKSTVTFSASKSVTSTICYKEIVNIEKHLITKCGSASKDIRDQAHLMRDKFEKYWDGLLNMNLLVIIASIFDPRNKMQFASLCFEQLYGKGTIETRQLEASVSSVLKKLYDEYSLRLSPADDGAGNRSDHGDSEQPSVACGMSDDEDDYVGVDVLYDNMVDQRRSEECFSELDIYLAEKTELKVENSLGLPYDVLDWWRCNTSKFPILSQLASDVLAIQVSSVASESAFSTSGRVLDPYRSSLTPYMIEVLLCLQQWLRCSYQSQASVANLVQMLEEEKYLDSLDSRNSIATSQ